MQTVASKEISAGNQSLFRFSSQYFKHMPSLTEGKWSRTLKH